MTHGRSGCSRPKTAVLRRTLRSRRQKPAPRGSSRACIASRPARQRPFSAPGPTSPSTPEPSAVNRPGPQGRGSGLARGRRHPPRRNPVDGIDRQGPLWPTGWRRITHRGVQGAVVREGRSFAEPGDQDAGRPRRLGAAASASPRRGRCGSPDASRLPSPPVAGGLVSPRPAGH